MTLRLVEEPPDLDQRRRGRRGDDRPGFYKIVFVEGAQPIADMPAVFKSCRQCGAAGVVLHQDPRRNDVERELWGRCQGIANADRMGLGPRRAGGE